MEQFEKYQQEMIEDTSIDELNIKDMQMKLPGIKHKWVGRLMACKREISKLKSQRKEAIEKASKLAMQESPISMSDAAAKRAAYSHELVIKINDRITDQEIIQEYLEKNCEVFRNMTWDIKNAVELMKLETL
jgi:hypothetical protein